MMNYFFPASWIPLYSMVTFSNIPYRYAIACSSPFRHLTFPLTLNTYTTHTHTTAHARAPHTHAHTRHSEVIERSEWQDRVVGKIKTAAPVVDLGAASLLALYFPRSRAFVRQALANLADRL